MGIEKATHKHKDTGDLYYKNGSIWYYFKYEYKEWIEAWLISHLLEEYLIPLHTSVQKEYLQLVDGGYKLAVLSDVVDGHDGLIEVPITADVAVLMTDGFIAFGSNKLGGFINDPQEKYVGYIGQLIWQRESEVIEPQKTLSFICKTEDISNNDLSAFNTQIGGHHYKSLKIQPMQYALENRLDYAQANVVKYVTRHASKGGKEDLLKAIHNIELMIEHYYGEA